MIIIGNQFTNVEQANEVPVTNPSGLQPGMTLKGALSKH